MRWPQVTHRSSAKHGQAGAAHVAAPGIRPGRYIVGWTLQQLAASNYCKFDYRCISLPKYTGSLLQVQQKSGRLSGSLFHGGSQQTINI